MLAPLKKSEEEKVRLIQEAAIGYYELQPASVEARAEEIYHRLSLGQPIAQVEPRWIPGVEAFLVSAVDELEGRAREWLASQIGIDLYDIDWDALDQPTWEVSAAKYARELLGLGSPLEALRVLQRRSTRLARSELYWYESQALYRSAQRLEAEQVAADGLMSLLQDPELQLTPDLLDWYGGPELSAPPSAAEVRRRLGYNRLVARLRDVAGATFVGRDREMAWLEEYLLHGWEANISGGVLSGGGSSRLPLWISGQGGIGKSALIARFALDQIHQLHFVHLDCASAEIEGSELDNPVATLLSQALQQIEMQIPGASSGAARLLGVPYTAPEGTRSSSPTSPLAIRKYPVLLILDNFEHLQYRSRDLTREIFHRLESARMPLLRVVAVSRRQPPDALAVERLEISVLDQEAADTLLRSRGIDSPEIRRDIIRTVRGNPLSLQLTADLVQRDGVVPNPGVGWLISSAAIQRRLLMRMLDHLQDPNARKLAGVALLLRTVTPEVIRTFLGGAAGLDVDSQSAAALFDILSNESSLFSLGADGVLHPRADLRRVMAPPLRLDQPQLARSIEEAAIHYYQQRDDPASRAEEIYHRLSIGQPPEQVEGRWVSGIEPQLRTAIDDLEGPPRAYLAARLGIDLDEIDWSSTDQTTWEFWAARRAGDLVQLDRPADAVDLLRSRSTRRPSSPLYALEGRILLESGRAREALQVVLQGLQDSPGDTQLTDLRKKCESVVGYVSGEAQGRLGAERQTTSFRLHDFDFDELTDLVKEALPYSTDLSLVLRQMGVNPGQFFGGESEVEEVLRWARENDRLNEFVSAIVESSPRSDRLREFLERTASRISYQTDDPLQTELLPGGRPLFGRLILREFLHNLFADHPRYRTLLVDGPPGSGKSYTYDLVANVASHEPGRLRAVRIDLDAPMTIADIVREIHHSLGWRLEDALLERMEPGARRIRIAVNLIETRARESKTRVVLLFDKSGVLRPEIADFLREMIVSAESVALILTGMSEDFVPQSALGSVRYEHLGEISRHDVENAFMQLLRNKQVDIHQLTHKVLEAAGERDRDYNSRLNSAAGHMLARIMAS